MINRKYAIHLLELCNHVYLNKDDCKVMIEALGYTNFVFFENKNSQAFGATKDNTVYIVFRGTQIIENPEIKDVIASFKPHKTTFKGNTVHKGYYEYYDNLKDTIHNYLDKFPKLEKVFVGYSLGASSACFLGQDYDGKVYAFATPKSFNYDYPDEKIVNILYNKDVLTQFPFGINNFKHIGKILTLKKDGSITENGSFKNVLNKLKLSLVLLILLPLIGLKVSIFIGRYFYNNHSISRYKDLLKGDNEN